MRGWYTVRPIESWPVPETKTSDRRSRWTFKAKWSDTIRILEDELAFIEANSVVMQIDVEERHIRQDGMLRADAVPRSPRVIVSFESKHGDLLYPCDSCELWQHNIRSIALALKALRAVDRYGVTSRAEQYKGWAKLPAPGEVFEFSSKLEAMAFLSDLLGEVVDSNEPQISNSIRMAKTVAHPDRGGNAKQFKLVVAAEKMLRRSS